MLAQEKKLDDSIHAMRRIFFASSEKSVWPADYSWKALKNAQYTDRAYEDARNLLVKQRPTPRAFYILCSHALENAKTEKKLPQSLWHSWFPDRGTKELLRLLDLADACPWIEGSYRAKALDRLNSVGHYRLVVRYWKKHKGEVEADVATWSETGRALTSLGRRGEARTLLSSWRLRRGVNMSVVANYVSSLSALRTITLRERGASAGDALRILPHDHCARYLAHVRAEACALMGDKEGLRDTWNRYSSYFDCKEKAGEWFPPGLRYLLTDIPSLVRYLQQNESGLYRRAVWGLRWRNFLRLFGVRRLGRTAIFPILWWAILILFWILLQLFQHN